MRARRVANVVGPATPRGESQLGDCSARSNMVDAPLLWSGPRSALAFHCFDHRSAMLARCLAKKKSFWQASAQLRTSPLNRDPLFGKARDSHLSEMTFDGID